MEWLTTLVRPFFEWLWQTTLIASLVICLILAAQKLLGNRLGPRWSHALWLVLLLRMVVPWAPPSRISLLNLVPSPVRQAQLPRLVDLTEQSENFHSAAVSEAAEAKTEPPATPGQSVHKTAPSQRRTPPKVEPPSGPALLTFHQLLPLLWLAGAALVSAYLFASHFTLWRIVKRERPSVNQALLELFEECKTRMGVQTLLAVVPSGRTRSPALFGFVRPRLLLPQEMLDTASRDEMRYVFLHELAHLKRHDIYLAWVASLLQVLHWFNPLVWFAFYRMRADRELACDTLVLARTGVQESQAYGRAIVALLRRFSRSRPLPALAGILENQSQLKRRIAMIAQFQNNSYRWSTPGIALVALLAAIAMVDPVRGTSAVGPAPQARPTVTMRSVEQDANVYLYEGVSPDGRYLCGHDTWRARGEIAIREVATGEERVIKPTKETPQEGDPQCPVMSPDNKTIAYLVSRPGATDDNLQSADVRLIGADGSGQRVLCRGAVSGGRVVRLAPKPLQWFPDGRRLLALGWPDLIHARNSIEIVSVSIEDGAV